MRSFDAVDDKLHEADFFLEEMLASHESWWRTRYLFSAFVSAARSVTFALQASMKDAPGFEDWYAKQQAQLRENKLARFFHDCRTDSQHIGFNHIVGGIFAEGCHLYWLGEPEAGRYKHVPELDVHSACRQYLKMICGLVDAVYINFGLLIDPDQIYTPDGLAKLGWSLEDVEAELGFPRGFTDIDWPHRDKYERRLALLRRSISGSGVKPLLQKYLERELAYPTGPFIIEY